MHSRHPVPQAMRPPSLSGTANGFSTGIARRPTSAGSSMHAWKPRMILSSVFARARRLFGAVRRMDGESCASTTRRVGSRTKKRSVCSPEHQANPSAARKTTGASSQRHAIAGRRWDVVLRRSDRPERGLAHRRIGQQRWRFPRPSRVHGEPMAEPAVVPDGLGVRH